ncbi:MAG: hypothetical protein JSU01_20820 [Bacteroidetes bacterium]|nr:hypothetical protein [Bacteroidota bacterium]
MHPYLVKLGVHTEVQVFFDPYFSNDPSGNLSFAYGDTCEVFGLAWHKIPASGNLWITGSPDSPTIRHVIICSSAMEAIAWLHCHHTMIACSDQLCFVATGVSLLASKLKQLSATFAGKRCSLLFSDDILGRVFDLKIAAAIRSQPVEVTLDGDRVKVEFRAAQYLLSADQFSLNAFEKLAAFRFHVQTLKPKGALTWLDRLTAAAFNL